MRRAAARLLAVGLVLVAVSACADGDDAGDAGTVPPATASPTAPGWSPSRPGEPATPEPDVELIEIEITDGRAAPPLERVDVARGTTVRIVVTSDQPDELHLHGYDLEVALAPGRPGVIEFVADQSGLFELETHESGLVLLQLQVR